MAKLHLDLDEFLEDEKPKSKPQPKKKRVVSSKSKSTKKSDAEKLRDITKGLPSAKLAKYDQYRSCRRVQWNITSVPEIIKLEAEKKAKEMGLGKKEFFYHCLRLAGVDIPDDKYLDSRKIIK
jgi:aconitase A